MPRLTVTRSVTHAAAERLLAPRTDIVEERPAGAAPDGDGHHVTGAFTLAHGPFAHYERTVRVGAPTPDGTVAVTQVFDYRLPPGTWPFLMNRPFRAALRRPRPDGRLPWWYPPQRPDARGATVLGLLATLSLIVGYHGTLLTQTMTFAADEFGAGTAAQGDALAAVRIGGVIAIYLGAVADRRGRRLILSLALLGCVVTTALGAAAPSLPALATTQALNRGTWAAASLLLAIIAAEEMPAGARAYALSLLAMTGGLGAGVALWLLPVADLSTRSWRLLYLFPLLFLPVIARFGRLVPESRRFERPHRDVRFAGHYGRLLLVAGAAFLLNVFMAPQSQFRNEFLREERGMAAATVSLFVVATSTPAGIGILAGGRLADTRGRRVVGATGIGVGTVLITLSFVLDGPAMWLTALVGGIFAAALVPTITVYGPELFPTSLRGRANGIASTTAMAGSVVGLLSAGRLEEATGSFGRTLAVLAAAPLAMAAVVLALFPETARRELEDLNPEDGAGAVPVPPAPEPGAEGVGTAAPG
ncbi:MAG TPA: MFS transporter [Acidimicrobiales bacterium]|nr:MFS transporter [Acidimicrobiales bacterium]